MTTLDYVTHGTCSRGIHVELDGNIIKSVTFAGGCPGNTTGISRLVAGMDVDDVISRLRGTPCRGKTTSCPDQLAAALERAKKMQ